MASNNPKAKADLENCRLEAQHEVYKNSFDSQLVFAPLQSVDSIRVLDSAGANGYWVRDYRDSLPQTVRDHPESLFVCADVNPLMLAKESERNGSIQYNTFDLVHQRLAISASKKVPLVDTIKRFATLLKPGSGWLQLVEIETSSDSSKENDYLAMEDFKYLLHKVSSTMGVRPYFANGLAEDLRDAGLVDIQEKRIQVRFGRAIYENEELFKRSIAYPGLPWFAEGFKDWKPSSKKEEVR
ncbi:hypothetical protein PRZ48_010130 [Zasmidium cellare]|uniref:Methyltransferase domain-containing protein n=1 Tax=Zasmidium cellare TaxID=395010 RepID=A0ABR0EDQ9_ZASCE|nr:hypothetical protein PRZ48_010130 [Zasmidium cellare]